MTVALGFVPSPEGRAAASRAIAEAALQGTTLIVVNASRGSAPAETTMASEGDLKALRAEADQAGVRLQTVQPPHDGSPAEQMLSVVESHKADLLVIGIRKRSAVGKLILGSTALTLLTHAHCAVLAVKAAETGGF